MKINLRRWWYYALSLILSIGVIVAFASPPASAADRGNNVVSSEQTQIDKLAHNLEVLFTRYVPVRDGHYSVNYNEVKKDGLETQINDFELTARTMNQFAEYNVELKYNNGYMSRGFNGNKFAMCMVYSVLGIPSNAVIAGAWSSIVTAISAWNWGLAASTIVRALGPAFAKGFLKTLGGPAAIAIALAGGAALCLPQSW